MKGVEEFSQLVKLMAKLRSPDGCPWDREQNHDSLRPYCIEEAYEVVDAIESNDMERLKDELGDLLLQVVFHAQMADEAKAFSVADVVQSINDKLVRRHPHVFRRRADDEVNTAEEVVENWAKIKEKEGRRNLLEGIPRSLPALLRATRMGEKAATVGFDWRNQREVWKKVEEELAELRAKDLSQSQREDEFGDLLFTLANLSRHMKIDAELSLRKATEKFARRFHWLEGRVRATGKGVADCSFSELNALWEEAKKET